MEKLAASEVLRKLAVGEVDLDEISEVIRSAELVIKSYRSEMEGLRIRWRARSLGPRSRANSGYWAVLCPWTWRHWIWPD